MKLVGRAAWMGCLGFGVALAWGCGDEGGGADTGDVTSPADGDATTGGTDATNATDAADTASGAAPTLTSVVAHVAGTKGIDLDLALVGGDADRDVALLRVRVFDAADQPVLAFRNGLSQTPDSHEGLVSFTTPVAGQLSFVTNVRLRGLVGEFPAIAKVEVALRDGAGHFSPDVATDVVPQVVRQLGDACDADAIEDRCAAGRGCRGTPAQCQEGLAPEVTKVAYLKGEGGTRILVQGTDPEDDLLSVLIEFLDNAGQPLLVDLDNDEVPESQDFEVNAAGLAVDGEFIVRVTPVAGFEDKVPQIAVTPTDAANHTGARKTSKLATTPVRNVGQVCDPYGFDVCNATSVCSPGVPGAANTCKAKAQLGTAECAAAPVLDPAGGVVSVSGVADGPSIWDPPTGCSAGDSKGRPEATAVLHLESAAAKVTLTTDLPGTNFDTVLYVLPGCGAANVVALGCADDSPEGSAAGSLVLEGVPAGDYLIVVDAWGPVGGSFTLSAELE